MLNKVSDYCFSYRQRVFFLKSGSGGLSSIFDQLLFFFLGQCYKETGNTGHLKLQIPREEVRK